MFLENRINGLVRFDRAVMRFETGAAQGESRGGVKSRTQAVNPAVWPPSID
jgi:hypothetical protein